MRALPFLLASAGLSAAGAAQAAPGTTQSVILNPLSVVNTSDLDFGTVIPGATTGTATIVPATSARTMTGGTVAAGGSPQAATFVATGVLNRLYLITLPSAATTLTNGSGGTMLVDNFTHDAGILPKFGAGGVATVHVGGRLNVGANQADGLYSGTFTITIIYL